MEGGTEIASFPCHRGYLGRFHLKLAFLQRKFGPKTQFSDQKLDHPLFFLPLAHAHSIPLNVFDAHQLTIPITYAGSQHTDPSEYTQFTQSRGAPPPPQSLALSTAAAKGVHEDVGEHGLRGPLNPEPDVVARLVGAHGGIEAKHEGIPIVRGGQVSEEELGLGGH